MRKASVARPLPVAALITAALMSAVPAQAAVKVCRGPHSSGIVVGRSEAEAKRRAIELWSLKVPVTGETRFAGWPLAAKKVLRCSPPKDGQVACIAIASACVIQQVPPKKNDKGKPGKAGAIEA